MTEPTLPYPQNGPPEFYLPPPTTPYSGFGPPPAHGYYPPATRGTNGMAIASMVLGILWLWWLGSILALIFGYVAKRQIADRGDSGGGLATAGIVLGWVGIAFLMLALGGLAVSSAQEPYSY